MWAPAVYSDELYHHGILGMKWGVRRYQNKDGSLTPAGRKHLGYFSKERRAERKEAREYDYKKSDQYKNANRSQKAQMSKNYNTNKATYGKGAANKIEYNVNVKGADRKKMQRNAMIKHIAIGTGLVLAVNLGPYAIEAGKAYMQYGRGLAAVNTHVSDLYAASKGLNTVKGGFTTGFKHAQQGKKIVDALSKYKFR